MYILIVGVALLLLSFRGTYGQPTGLLYCRVCVNAATLQDCTMLTACDPHTSACYTEKTAGLTGVRFNAGCRPRDMCPPSDLLIGKKRADNFVVCSRCCTEGRDCNAKLCGIQATSTGLVQCYSCGFETTHPGVHAPEECLHLTTCNSNEVCLISTRGHAGIPFIQYGCRNTLKCKLLMQSIFSFMDSCSLGNTNDCSNAIDCDVCCGDSGCNHDTCNNIKRRMFLLHKAGVLDDTTLKMTNISTVF